MDEHPNETAGKPAARIAFARRLRELRIPKGFRTARSLARALSIDENRYTRYERAEVEPDLDLLLRICDTLSVTPNELLGVEPSPRAPGTAFHDAAGTGALVASATGFARAEAEAPPAHAVQSIGWALCGRVSQLRQDRASRLTTAADTTSPPPLAYLQMVTSLQQDLDRQPFEIIRQIVRDPALTEAPDAAAREVRDLILRLTETLARTAEPQLPG